MQLCPITLKKSRRGHHGATAMDTHKPPKSPGGSSCSTPAGSDFEEDTKNPSAVRGGGGRYDSSTSTSATSTSRNRRRRRRRRHHHPSHQSRATGDIPDLNTITVTDPGKDSSGSANSAGSAGGGGGDGSGSDGDDDEEVHLHVTALDEIVSVNSFFTGAVFVGLSLNNNTSLVSNSANDPCNASKHLLRQLVLWEVLSFSCFLMSSLIAQGLKLQLTICSTIQHRNKQRQVASSPRFPPDQSAQATPGDLENGAAGMVKPAMHPRAVRIGMLVTAFGSIGGTVFLMLSIINVIQLRLGVLSCGSPWSKAAIFPLLVLVTCGVGVFVCTVLVAFFT